MRRFSNGAATLIACAAFAGFGATQESACKVGEKAPDFAFKGAMLNGDGRTELKEFRGNVVLIDWWGYH
jgi:hypothetical protein